MTNHAQTPHQKLQSADGKESMSYYDFYFTLLRYMQVQRQHGGEINKRFIHELRSNYPEFAATFDLYDR